jgi:tetratricopeptide (TPR) repeat protein
VPLAERLDYAAHKLRAIVLLVFGRNAAAGQVFDAMLRRWPRDAYALASRAHLRAQGGRRGEAIADAQALVDAHPQRSAADWFNLAFLLEQDDRLEAAIAAFRRAVEIDPKLDRAWYGLGLALIRLDRLDEAVTALKRNTQLQPMSPYGWYQLARVHFNRHQPEETMKIIRHLKGFEPKVAAQLERETGLVARPPG